MNSDMKNALNSFESVWQRVTAGCGEIMPTQTRETDDAERLCRFIQSEYASAQFYMNVAKKTRGNVSRMLLGFAADEKRHLRNLQLEYFLLTGDSCRPEKPASMETGLMSRLREGYVAEGKAAANYEKAAEKTSSERLRKIYLSHAADEKRHKKHLRALITKAMW